MQILPANISISDLMDTDNLLADELVAEGLSRAGADALAVWHRKQYTKAAKALSKKLKRYAKSERLQSQTPITCSPASIGGDVLCVVDLCACVLAYVSAQAIANRLRLWGGICRHNLP